MTGYGQAEQTVGGYRLTVEVRSVNHRFADVVVRLPREWARHEDGLRQLVLQHVRRGRVEVLVASSLQDAVGGRPVRVNEALLAAALGVLRTVGAQAPLDFEAPALGDLLAIPGLFEVAEAGDSPIGPDELNKAAAIALQELVAMRRNEGERLRAHLLGLHGELRALLSCLRGVAPQASAAHRERLALRMQELLQGAQTDPGRIAFEAALLAERGDIEEELHRLDSHAQQLVALLSVRDEAVGRRLDFLVQELHREVNTIGAKAADLQVAELVLDAKHVIEQMREQLQNVE